MINKISAFIAHMASCTIGAVTFIFFEDRTTEFILYAILIEVMAIYFNTKKD